MIILGIDPGLATMGYGALDCVKGTYKVLDYGVVTTPKECALPERLLQLESGVQELISTFRPDAIAIARKRSHFAHGGKKPRSGSL